MHVPRVGADGRLRGHGDDRRAGGAGADWAGAGNNALYEYVRTIPAPRVVVVKDLDIPPAHGSLWGEVHATIFGALGCVGCVTDGSVRDFDEVRAMGFHFFAAGPSVSHAYVRVEAIGETVEIGGLSIAPGDLLHADQHGVLKIPPEIAAEPTRRGRPGDRDRADPAQVGPLRRVRSRSPRGDARPPLTLTRAASATELHDREASASELERVASASERTRLLELVGRNPGVEHRGVQI